MSCFTRCVKPYPHLLDLPEIWSPEAGGVERQAVPPELGQEVADGVPGDSKDGGQHRAVIIGQAPSDCCVLPAGHTATGL